MTFLKTAAGTIRSSIYSPSFYRDLATRPFSYSFQYLIFLTLGLSVLYTVWVGFVFGPSAVAFIRNVGPTVLDTIPSDLVVTIQKGQLSINQPEPYAINVTEGWRPSAESSSAAIHKNLLVIDTTAPLSVETLRADDTYALVGKSGVMSEKKSNQIQVDTFPTSLDATISRATVAPYIDKLNSLVSSWSWLVIIVLAIFVCVGIFLFTLVAHLLYLLFAALLALIIGKARHVPLTYGKAYQTGIHIITLQLVVGFLLTVVGTGLPAFTPTLLFVLLAFVNLAPQKAS